MSTRKLYQEDVYTRRWETTVSSVCGDVVYLEETAFFPEGGGQSCDIGEITLISDNPFSFKVIDVQEDGADVSHKVLLPGNVTSDSLKAGDPVSCELDWQRRFDNMQRHCGEHILSGIFHRECGGVNRGFHMGEDYMTIDISLEEEPSNPSMSKPEEIDWNLAIHCQLEANKVIWANEPVTVFRFDSREEAETMPLRKKLDFDEDISIVCIGSAEKASDCVACCGTHPATAGQVGLIKILKVENYKGMFRIYFEAGERALADFNRKHDILTDLSNSYSSSIEDFPSKLKAQEEKLLSAKNELYQAKKALTDNECQRLDSLLAAEDSSPVIILKVDTLGIDDVFNMAKLYMGKDACRGKLILLYAVKDTSYVLVSQGDIKCGGLVREYASFYNGKGGGNDMSARAIFQNDEDAALFADLISKHLR